MIKYRSYGRDYDSLIDLIGEDLCYFDNTPGASNADALGENVVRLQNVMTRLLANLPSTEVAKILNIPIEEIKE